VATQPFPLENFFLKPFQNLVTDSHNRSQGGLKLFHESRVIKHLKMIHEADLNLFFRVPHVSHFIV
jgi:hypothetical protein